MQRREGGSKPLSIPDGSDGIDMLMTHAERMHKFAAYGVAARNAELLLNDMALRESIKSKNDPAGFKSIVDAVHSEVAGYQPTDTPTRKLAKLNQTAAGALIAGKFSLMVKQPRDAIVAAAYDDGGFQHLLAGLGEMKTRGPADVIREMKSVLSQFSGEWNGRYEFNAYAGEITSGLFKRRSYFRPNTLIEKAAEPLQMAEMISAALPNYLAAKEAVRQELGIQSNDYNAYACLLCLS